MRQAGEKVCNTKRRKDAESTDYEPSRHLEESSSRAAALTRSDSENSYVAPFAGEKTSGSLFSSGANQAATEEDAGPTSPFQRAVAELQSQITAKSKELLELNCKERDSYIAEMLRLRCEIKLQGTELDQITKHAKRLASERDELREDNNALQAKHMQEVNKNNQLSDERERLRNDKKRLQNELGQEGERVQRLTDRITEIVADKDSLLKEKRRVEAKLAQEVDQQKELVVQLKNERDSLLTKIGERDQQAAMEDLELSNLIADLEKFKDECDHLKREKKTFLDEHDRLNDIVAEHYKDVGKLREELEAERDRNSRELAKRNELQERVDAELNSLRAEYSSHLDNCKITLEDLNAELRISKETLESKSRAVKAARLVEAGYALHRKKEFSKAYQRFDEAIVLDADSMLPHIHKASAYYQQKDYEECRQTCILAMAAASGFDADKCVMAIFYELAAGASVKLADVHQADVQQVEVKPEQLAYLDDAVQFYGKSLDNYFDEAVVKSYKHCAKVLREINTNPELSQEALERGNAFFKVGDYENAKEQYDEAVKRNPGNGRLYLTRAWCHLKRTPTRCGKAIGDCKTALELDPNNG